MRRQFALALAASLAIAGASTAQVDITSADGSHVHVGAGGVDITGSGASGGRAARAAGHAECLDGSINVSGANAVLRVRGVCSKVNLSGTGNTVYLTLAPGAHVALTGTRNHLHWTPADPHGRPPVIESPGVDNTYDRAS